MMRFLSIAICAVIANNSFGAGFEEREPLVRDLRPEIIAEYVQREFREHENVLDHLAGKDIVAFLGNTGAGKSTLVNLLSGRELRADRQDYVLVNPNDERAMPIGIGGNAQTLYPKFIDVDGDLRLFDIPGFNDTEGAIRDLVNGAFIKRILTRARSVRLVFVVGEDEFTAVRGAASKKILGDIKRMFDADLVDNSIFVCTKSSRSNEEDAKNFLLERTSREDLEWSKRQFSLWETSGRFLIINRPDTPNIPRVEDAGSRILDHIRVARGTSIRDIDISGVYPRETISSLVRMFSPILQNALDRKITVRPDMTLSECDHIIGLYDTDVRFWESFDEDVARNTAVSLLKEFCIIPYNESFRAFQISKVGIRLRHIDSLRRQRETRVVTVEKMTEARAQEVIAECIRTRGDVGVLDFGYHPYFYDQVCGADVIGRLTEDALEHEVVRRKYANFISRHSYEQMGRWKQQVVEPQITALERRFESQVSALTQEFSRRMDATLEELHTLQRRYEEHSHGIRHPEVGNVWRMTEKQNM